MDLNTQTPPPPPKNDIPLQQPSEHNVGVGTPNIGVEEKQTPATDANIEVEAYNSPPPASQPPQPAPTNPEPPLQVKNYQNTNPQDAPQPPIKAGGSNTTLTILIILALILGSVGGFFGFRYLDKSKTSASTETTPTAVASPSLDVNTWQTYTSTLEKFKLKYPTGWFASTTSGDADSLVFASNKESLEGTPTGYKVEINFQNANGLTLQKWVEANTATTGEQKPAKEITVSGQTAYQQELSKNGAKVATYIERPSKIMVVTYSAPENVFGSGGQWYNSLVDSITLM